MKKFLSALVLLSFLAVLAVPMVVSAQVPEKCTIVRDTGITDCPSHGDVAYNKCYQNGTEITCPTGVSGAICCVAHSVATVTDWIFVILLSIAVILVLIGAINILTAAGDPLKLGKGRDYILWAAIGLVVAFFAKAIPAIVRAILT